jgi:hypothetical protein
MAKKPAKPVEDDLRHDDQEYNPNVEPKKARAWINLLKESEDAFEEWHNHCDNIDRLYASLSRLSSDLSAKAGRTVRDKEFQMFWANCEVIKPSIYAKAPIPVVVPKFKDRRPVYQAASEVAERCAIVAFDLTEINELMLLIRDDLAMISRGVAWCRYESGKGGYYSHEKVCIDFKGRRDFLHSISRNWREVTWVAAASYLTRPEARERFKKHSGDAYQDADYKVDKESKEIGGADNRERAKFWEIWDKTNQRVLWVAEGCEDILDDDDPHLELRGFYPCPKPAYGTLQRGSLVPVPDVMQYRDQLDEVNMLTGRIHALSDALEAKGFYAAGGSESAEAIETAVKIKTPGRLLVPIKNFASFGGMKDPIIWMPIDMIAQTITGLVALRKEVISDIYQIMGLSDIMRGATDPNETLGAQQLKTQYGSTRIRDKQHELVRLSRDLVEISLEIITSKFSDVTIIEMSQTQLPTRQMQEQQAQQIQQKVAQSIQQAQQNPQAAQQVPAQIEQAQKDLKKLQEQPTIDQVLRFLKSSRAKSFVLDIETDSTIMPDENAEKQRRTEFTQVLGGLLQQLSAMIAAEPSTAEFCGEVLKFSTAPFRAGRQLDGAIDGLVEQMKAKGEQPRGDDPTTAQGKIALQAEQMKQQTETAKIKSNEQIKAAELKQKDKEHTEKLQNDRSIKAMELQAKARDDEAEMQRTNQDAMHDREKHQSEMMKKQVDVQIAQEKQRLAAEQMQMRRGDMAAKAQERQAMQAFKMAQPPKLPGGPR